MRWCNRLITSPNFAKFSLVFLDFNFVALVRSFRFKMTFSDEDDEILAQVLESEVQSGDSDQVTFWLVLIYSFIFICCFDFFFVTLFDVFAWSLSLYLVFVGVSCILMLRFIFLPLFV